jgi:hypothetical protein
MIFTGKPLRKGSQHSSMLVRGKWKSVRVTEVATGLHELRAMRTQPRTGQVTERSSGILRTNRRPYARELPNLASSSDVP